MKTAFYRIIKYCRIYQHVAKAHLLADQNFDFSHMLKDILVWPWCHGADYILTLHAG